MDEEDEWIEEDEDDTDAGRRLVYNKSKWFLLLSGRMEKYRQGISFKAGGSNYDRRFSDRGGTNTRICGPTDRKIGPFGHRNVSIVLGFFLFSL